MRAKHPVNDPNSHIDRRAEYRLPPPKDTHSVTRGTPRAQRTRTVLQVRVRYVCVCVYSILQTIQYNTIRVLYREQ